MLNDKAAKLLDAALQLGTAERAIFIARLTDSLHDEMDPAIEEAWIAECDQRWSRYQRGKTQAKSLENVMREIRLRISQS